MPKAIIAKETLKVLEDNAPKGYDVKGKLFDIEVYDFEDRRELFNTLYLSKKKDDVDYLHKLIAGMGDYTGEELLADSPDENSISVEEKMIHAHKNAAMVILDGERNYVYYK